MIYTHSLAGPNRLLRTVAARDRVQAAAAQAVDARLGRRRVLVSAEGQGGLAPGRARHAGAVFVCFCFWFYFSILCHFVFTRT